jgi:elongation factor P hydroxylase
MIVFHGSTEVVKTPDTEHSYRRLDFGKGFYTTTVKEQAERWAKRKAAIHGKQRGFVNVYEMTLSSAQHIMDFSDDLETWIDFVCDCRNGSDEYLKYDIIKGKVANDKVFRVVDMYKRGI